MFVVLRVNEPPKGLIKKAKQKRALLNAQAETVSTDKGLPFFMLDIPENPKNSDWDSVAKKCGKYTSRIVAPRSLTLPDYGKLKRFVPSFMPSVLTFNAAASALEKAKADPSSITVTVTDRNGWHASRICRLLPFSSTVRVVTSKPERYLSACETALNEHGASIIVRSSYEPSSKPDIVICCDSGESSAMQSAAIFGYKHSSEGKMNFCGSGIDLTERHRKIIPQDIDPIDFAGAITELCGGSEYKTSSFAYVTPSCNICDNPTPETCIKCYVSGKL